jgi:hypothetical protein
MQLTQEERYIVEDWLYDSETAFLVEMIMGLLPYEDAKRLADRLTEKEGA